MKYYAMLVNVSLNSNDEEYIHPTLQEIKN